MRTAPIPHLRRSPARRLIGSASLVLSSALSLVACSESRVELEDAETVPQVLGIRTGDSVADRFGLRTARPEVPFGGFRAELPDGWRELPPEQFRDYQAEAPNGVRVWVTRLKGDGGGPRSNLSRWAVQQLGLDEVPDIGGLPRRPWLGGSAYVVRLQNAAGECLFGRMLFGEDRSVFVRISGSVEDVDPLLADFEALADSLQEAQGRYGVSWLPPADFELIAPRSRTIATYEVLGAQAWVLIEGGDLAGLDANIGRWLGQVGLDPSATTPDLVDLNLGGIPATLLRARGATVGLDAVYCFDGQKSVILKMQGDLQAMDRAREAFDAWVRSFRIEEI